MTTTEEFLSLSYKEYVTILADELIPHFFNIFLISLSLKSYFFSSTNCIHFTIPFPSSNPENWLKRSEKEISVKDIEEKTKDNYIGLKAGSYHSIPWVI